MSERPAWWPSDEITSDRIWEGGKDGIWQAGVEAGVKAAISRYEELINSSDCGSFREALAILKVEAGIE